MLSRHSTAFGRALALAAVVCSFALAIGAAPAAAQSEGPCWRRVLHDWLVDNRINGTYPPSCLKQAMAHLGPDAQEYSSFSGEANRALLADERWQRDHPRKKAHYNLGVAGGKSGDGIGPPSLHPGSDLGPGTGGSGPLAAIFKSTGPTDPTSIPTPLKVLGGLAILLILAAGASFAARRIQSRRVQPARAASDADLP